MSNLDQFRRILTVNAHDSPIIAERRNTRRHFTHATKGLAITMMLSPLKVRVIAIGHRLAWCLINSGYLHGGAAAFILSRPNSSRQYPGTAKRHDKLKNSAVPRQPYTGWNPRWLLQISLNHRAVSTRTAYWLTSRLICQAKARLPGSQYWPAQDD